MFPSFMALLLCLLVSTSFCYGQILNKVQEKQDETPIAIDAQISIVCDEIAHKCVATGDAKAQKGDKTVYGDVLTVYFTNDKKREITTMTAQGHVRMETPKETAYGEHAHYDVKLDRVLMTGGNLKIVTQKETLTARDSIEYWHTKNQGIAKGKALAQFPEKEQLIQADTLVVHFKPSSEKTEEGEEKLNIDRVEAEGNVLASGPNGFVTADRGVYYGQTEIVEVFNNVKIAQKNNLIEGGYGRFNVKTNVGEVFPHPRHTASSGSKKRISGIIIPKDAKNMKKNKADAPAVNPKRNKSRQVLPFSAKKKKDTSS